MRPARARREFDQRVARAVRRGVPGTFRGLSELAQPIPARPHAEKLRPRSKPNEHATWASDGGVVVTDVSDPYEVMIGGTHIEVVINLTAALTGDTDIDVLLNGSAVDTVTVASGTTREAARIAETTVPGDVITLETTAAGTGTARAIAQLKVGT